MNEDELVMKLWDVFTELIIEVASGYTNQYIDKYKRSKQLLKEYGNDPVGWNVL